MLDVFLFSYKLHNIRVRLIKAIKKEQLISVKTEKYITSPMANYTKSKRIIKLPNEAGLYIRLFQQRIMFTFKIASSQNALLLLRGNHSLYNFV